MADERPQIAVARTSCTSYPDTPAVPSNAAVNVLNRAHSITADVDMPKGGADGAVLSRGDVHGGYCLYVQGGKLLYVHNHVGMEFMHVESSIVVPTGWHKLRFAFELTGKSDIVCGKGTPARGQLDIDGKLVGQGDMPLTMPLTIGLAGGVVCGAESGSPVRDKFKPLFKFSGKLYGVTMDVTGDLNVVTEPAMNIAMARQ